ncbi:hypothetical protein EJB05_26094 [Eragrostis curvula]|uniref:Uncharacterized protein n=1 Tax=Eragrostis curvula TaxID=38414 RepID=A0A5J9UJY3_9POAL|nr:hypothetical protein EJB05_26094 [Eragrostis curvula]
MLAITAWRCRSWSPTADAIAPSPLAVAVGSSLGKERRCSPERRSSCWSDIRFCKTYSFFSVLLGIFFLPPVTTLQRRSLV